MRKIGLCVLIACGFLGLGTAAPADELDIEQYRGKVVVLDFWASWCVPCRRSFPWLNDMQDRYGDAGLVVIGINLDKHANDAQRFLQDTPAQFRIVMDPEGELARRYDVVAMPSSYVIGRNGEIVTTHYGFKVKKQDDYETTLRSTLAAD